MKVREIRASIDHISERATTETAAKLLAPGAVLVVVRGMILVHTFPSAVLRVPAAINQDMKALIPTSELLPDFLCAFFWAFNSNILNLVEKSTHDTRKLETPKLLDFSIPVPPLSVQHHIVAHLDGLQAKVNALKKLQTETAAELAALLPSILDKAFKGEL
ncbi:MAG: restriction endonuclease subunit S [Nitrospira sp.]|nr:restriction endonuclease subunit S [Nitrospira sp.]